MRKCLEWRRPYGLGDPVSHSRSIHVYYASGIQWRCALGSALKAVLTSHGASERPAVTALRAGMRRSQRETLITTDWEEAGQLLEGLPGGLLREGRFPEPDGLVQTGGHFRGMELQTHSTEVGSDGNCKSSVQWEPGICREEWELLGCLGQFCGDWTI